MKKVLVTGGSGFFGGILKNRLLAEGFNVVNLDLVADPDSHHNLTSVQGDIRDAARVDRLFAEERFDSVMHCAAMLAHEKIDDATLWSSKCRRHSYPGGRMSPPWRKKPGLHLQQLPLGT